MYDEPVRDENAVHDLEHGTVWITYDPELDDDEVDELAERAAARTASCRRTPASPRPSWSPSGVASSSSTGSDDPRLELFLEEFGDGHTAPEPFASCAGGVQAADGQDGANV